MKKNRKLSLSCKGVFDIIFMLESILKITRETCYYKQESLTYYGLESFSKQRLCEERDNYINMLSLALEKVETLKQVNQFIEDNLQ